MTCTAAAVSRPRCLGPPQTPPGGLQGSGARSKAPAMQLRPSARITTITRSPSQSSSARPPRLHAQS
eukprot:8297569-Pyramimonas_sp.AAC.1